MTAWTSQDECPVCGQPEALIALGVRYDRLHRWRPWLTTITHLALCSACDALVATERRGHARQHGLRTVRAMTSHPARPLDHCGGLSTTAAASRPLRRPLDHCGMSQESARQPMTDA